MLMDFDPLDLKDIADVATEAWLETNALRLALGAALCAPGETAHTIETFGILMDECRHAAIEQLKEMHPKVAANTHIE